MATSGGAVALAAELQRRAMTMAEQEIEGLDLAAEVAPADMLAITAWGARLYLLGLGDRAAAAAAAAPPAAEPEWCQCGHEKSAHGAGRGGAGRGGAPGHGECLASAAKGARRRCSCDRFVWVPPSKARPAPGAAVSRVEVRRRRLNRPTSDKREVRDACAQNRHRTPGKDGMCACGVFAIDDLRSPGVAR